MNVIFHQNVFKLSETDQNSHDSYEEIMKRLLTKSQYIKCLSTLLYVCFLHAFSHGTGNKTPYNKCFKHREK